MVEIFTKMFNTPTSIHHCWKDAKLSDVVIVITSVKCVVVSYELRVLSYYGKLKMQNFHLKNMFSLQIKGAVTDMRYFAWSKFSRSLVHKKNFSLV